MTWSFDDEQGTHLWLVYVFFSWSFGDFLLTLVLFMGNSLGLLSLCTWCWSWSPWPLRETFSDLFYALACWMSDFIWISRLCLLFPLFMLGETTSSLHIWVVLFTLPFCMLWLMWCVLAFVRLRGFACTFLSSPFGLSCPLYALTSSRGSLLDSTH